MSGGSTLFAGATVTIGSQLFEVSLDANFGVGFHGGNDVSLLGGLGLLPGLQRFRRRRTA